MSRAVRPDFVYRRRGIDSDLAPCAGSSVGLARSTAVRVLATERGARDGPLLDRRGEISGKEIVLYGDSDLRTDGD
jgi:hypothetical protein